MSLEPQFADHFSDTAHMSFVTRSFLSVAIQCVHSIQLLVSFAYVGGSIPKAQLELSSIASRMRSACSISRTMSFSPSVASKISRLSLRAVKH